MIPRLVAATTFADANLSMAVGLPGERRVSVELFEQLSNSENAQGVSTITGAWGQFVIHDMMQTSTSGDAVEILPAPVDPKLSSPFYLRRATRGNGGLGTPINFVSSYLDGSAVHGNSTARVGITQHTGGLMLARADTGLPAGTADVMEAVRPTSWLALAGDRRANNNPGLFSIQGLMVLEHNYWAAAYEVRKSELGLHSAQEVFDMARRRVIAEIQAITYQEYIPAILGAPLPKYTGYKPSVDPSVSVTHVCAAARYGHSGIRSVYPRRDPEGSPHINGPVLLRDAFFDPGEWVLDGGIAPILMGMAMSKEMAVDVAYVNDMRNFLGLGNVPDLSSIDVFRGRDCGVASYADARQHYGLRRPTVMSDLTNVPKLLGALNTLYGGDVNKVDFMVGALLERPNGTALVGPLFAAVMRDQYMRTRDGDRFWFENTADARNRFTDDELVDIHSTTLAEIVRRHFPRYSSFPQPAFYFHKSVDQVSSGGDAVSGTGTTANTRAEGSVQIDSQLSITWVLDAATFAGTLQLQDVACNQQAWMGMGLGSNMFDADVVLCEWTGSVMQCTDRHASGLEVPAEDTAAQGRDVTLTASSCEDGVLSASFTRPATATDGNADKAFTTGSQPAIFAYKEESGLAYHGQNRYSLIVDFGSGASVAVSSARDIRRHIVHGVAMFIAWGILAPMGIFVMRFLRHKMYWLTVHQVLMVLTIVIAAVGALGSLAGSGDEPITTHAIMGLVLVSVGVLLGALGSVVKYFHNKPFPPTQYALYRRIHKVLGYCAALLACACLYTGLGDLTHTYQFLMALWLVFLAFGGLMYEWYFNFQGRRKDAIPEAPPLLVKFTARQVVRQVAMGAKWVIMAGRLYDVQNLLDVHPGGSYLLRRCIGADVTSMFHGKTTVDGMVSPHKHTFRAAKLLTSLCVGTLVADDGEDSDSSDTPARPKLPASSSRQSLNASAHRRPAATASHADIAKWSGGSDPLANAAPDEGSSSQPDDMEFHPWTVAHTQWVTAPSRTKPVKLLMLMPPLGSEFEIPFSYRHFGKHMHAQTKLAGGNTRLEPVPQGWHEHEQLHWLGTTWRCHPLCMCNRPRVELHVVGLTGRPFIRSGIGEWVRATRPFRDIGMAGGAPQEPHGQAPRERRRARAR